MNTFSFQFLAEDRVRNMRAEADHRRLVAEARRSARSAPLPTPARVAPRARLEAVRSAIARIAARRATA